MGTQVDVPVRAVITRFHRQPGGGAESGSRGRMDRSATWVNYEGRD